ncbi:caspase family protein [Streptomyces sp. LARHCF249]
MAELTVSDPTRVHAVVVGIEHYPRVDAGWDLVGACADAVRFARWLRQRGVPAANITLLLAAAPGSHSGLNEAADAIGLEPTYVRSRDRIMDHFTPRGAVPEGDVLFVYWGGHGVLDHGNRRLLLCPDASDADRRCIELTNLQEHLTGRDVTRFPQHVFLVDSCALFIEHRHVEDQPGPALAAFPAGRREAVTQFTLFAAAAGQVAGQGTVAGGSGDFSTVVTGWLEEHSPKLTPDLEALVGHVKEHFTAAAGGQSRGRAQTPVSLLIQPLGGNAQVFTPPRPARPEPARAPADRAAGGGGHRAGVWAGVGALALVAMVAIVALALHRPGGDGRDGRGDPVGAAGSAEPGKAAASGPSPSPSPSPTPSPPVSGSAPPGASAAPAAAPASQKPAATPSAGSAGPSCGAEHTTTNVQDVLETVCYEQDGKQVTMVAFVRATVPKDVTVSLWLVGQPGNTYVFPAGGPRTWTIRAGAAPQRLAMPVAAALTPKAVYEVHVSTMPAGQTLNATANPNRGHSMLFTAH